MKNKELLSDLIAGIIINILACCIKAFGGAFIFPLMMRMISDNTNIYIKELGYWDSFLFLLVFSSLVDLFFKTKTEKND